MSADTLAAPFAHIDGREAVRIARSVFGRDVSEATRFDTERDDTFRVTGPEGSFALKLAHPADELDGIEFEVACVEHALARDPELPLARFLPVAGAPAEASVSQRVAIVGDRYARCQRWRPGVLLRDAPRSEVQIGAVANVQARLLAAFADLDHPGARRHITWDVQHLGDQRERAFAVPEPDRDAVFAILDRFDAEVAPVLDSLPHQVVHNDVNLDNVLVAADRPTDIAAVLDFGDATRTARVFDFAISASYLLPSSRADPGVGAVLTAVIGGARGPLDLTPTEVGLLPLLTAGRLAQRLILGWWLAEATPDNAEYVSRSLALTARQLSALSSFLDGSPS